MEWILETLLTNYWFICSSVIEKYKCAVINSGILLCSKSVLIYHFYTRHVAALDFVDMSELVKQSIWGMPYIMYFCVLL